ncbi:MAG TPA: tetratricopeptide repeat protein, partial [Chitinophagales bacterium]|nr:tetratricopeptide repeat protein [Chitinophagales bacterium]
MNAEQLLKQVALNRDLITRLNKDAFEHLDTLQKDYAHVIDEESAISIELNKSLIQLCFHANYTAAIDCSLAALEKYGHSTCYKGVALHLKMVGMCHAHIGEFDLAVRYLLEALDTIGSHSPVIRADILHVLAWTEDFKSPESIKIVHYLTEALELIRDTDDDVRKANFIMGIGNYYNNINDCEKALENFKQAAETFENKYRLAGMGNCYSNMGSCYLKLNDIANAQHYLQKSLELRLKFGSPDELGIAYYNMAVLSFATKDLPLCEDYLYKALK